MEEFLYKRLAEKGLPNKKRPPNEGGRKTDYEKTK